MLRVLHVVVDAQVLVGRVDSRAGVSEAGGRDRHAQRFDEGVDGFGAAWSDRVVVGGFLDTGEDVCALCWIPALTTTLEHRT
jgi:hypothetical protein